MVLGKSDEQKKLEARRKENERQRRQNLAQAAMSQAKKDHGGEILRQLSEIDDLPSFPGNTLDQFASKVISTSNLSEEDLESDHWVRQYIKVLYLARFPERDGLKGHTRAYAFGDKTEHRKPLDESDLADIEEFVHVTGMAASRSEDMKAVEESVRTIAESYVRNEDHESSGGGGLLGKIGLR